MKISKLNRLVTLQQSSGAHDAVGERITVWSNVTNCYAGINPLTINARFYAAQIQSTSNTEITIRYDSSISLIDETWRVLYGSRIFLIDGVINKNESDVYFVLICTEDKRTE